MKVSTIIIRLKCCTNILSSTVICHWQPQWQMVDDLYLPSCPIIVDSRSSSMACSCMATGIDPKTTPPPLCVGTGWGWTTKSLVRYGRDVSQSGRAGRWKVTSGPLFLAFSLSCSVVVTEASLPIRSPSSSSVSLAPGVMWRVCQVIANISSEASMQCGEQTTLGRGWSEQLSRYGNLTRLLGIHSILRRLHCVSDIGSLLMLSNVIFFFFLGNRSKAFYILC